LSQDSLNRRSLDLIEAARAVREHAHAPYSGYTVGAALLADDGRVFTGVNVENSAYPTCQCAECTALGTAVTAGARRFLEIAIVTSLGKDGRPGAPCGNCRQALSEFGTDLVVWMAGPTGDPVRARLADLLPLTFSGENL
jgi:cytidine deaminase